MRKLNDHTVPEPARAIIAELIKAIDIVMPDLLEGFYLTGSIPLNDFYPNKSDIDFTTICKRIPNRKEFELLKEIHLKLNKKHLKPDLSGSYITIANLTTNIDKVSEVVTFHEGKMKYDTFEMIPITLLQLKNYCITIFGTNATELPISITEDEVNKFMYQNINDYWETWLKQHSSILNRWIFLFFFPRFTEWSVLGVARQLYTLQSGEIVSKRKAGEFCLEFLPKEHHAIIKQALEIRKDERTYPFVRTYAIRPSLKRTRETLRCTEYIISLFNKAYRINEHNKN